MFDVGSGELLVILLVALLLFGGNLPQVARSLGRSVAELKRGFSESARPLTDAAADLEREIAETGEPRDGGTGPAGRAGRG